ncbi:hypothetical protein K501DRAFT_284373 [Backusella circina FSU 941]|nr:hypothetical protein K501DRAFT_284373 [Backusella circina FSU 941]
MDIMKDTPSLRKQVVDLTVLSYWESQNIKNIIEYFPNLEHFSFTRKYQEELGYIESKTTKSNGRMRYINDVDSCRLLCALSKAGLCSHLDEVCVSYFNTEKVLPVLKDMPVLKRLSLERSYINIAQLEMLHKNLPSLEHIGVHLEYFDDPIPVPTDITPAVSITDLFVQMESVFEEDQTSWLLYVSKKYPNLKKYHIEFESSCFDDEDMETFDNVYSVAYIPFLKSLGPQLESIHLPGAEYNNYKIFQKMDEYGCQIKDVVLFSDKDNTWRSALTQSNQAKYIENLTVYHVGPCSFDWLKSMEVLKSLSINFRSDDFKGDNEININMLLKSCSKTVKSVKFNYGNYCFDGDFDDSFQLEEMHLDSGRATSNVDQFIANCLPNLHILSLNGSIQSKAKLILPNHHFSYVRLYPYDEAHHGHFALKTIKDSKSYLYRTKNKKAHVNISDHDKFVKSIPGDSAKGEPFIDLVFGSVKKLIINNHRALSD